MYQKQYSFCDDTIRCGFSSTIIHTVQQCIYYIIHKTRLSSVYIHNIFCQLNKHSTINSRIKPFSDQAPILMVHWLARLYLFRF